MIAIERGRPDDVPAALKLLEENGLPVEGVTSDLLLMVARRDGRVIGLAGLEIYSDGALLRSVAVDRAFRGSGLGQRLTEAALSAAAAARAEPVFLLTTTADGFFRRFGFERIDRHDVPDSVRQSVEFVSACPASAVTMRRQPGAATRAGP